MPIVEKRLQYDAVTGLRVGRFDRGLNTSCILYRIGNTLIETGAANQWSSVKRFVSEHRVDQVLLSHHHEDHSGNAARIQKLTRATVLASEAAIPLLAGGFPLRRYQRVIWGTPMPVKADLLPDEIHLERGLTLRTIPTTGHSKDMVCFHEPHKGWLFTADLYVATRQRYLRQDEDLRVIMESIRHLLSLEFDTIFCVHRGVVTSGKKALAEKLEFFESLVEQAGRLHRQGWPIGAIRDELLGREDATRWITWNHYSKRNLIEGCIRVIDQREIVTEEHRS